MTTHRPIILRELPATKTTDPAAIARNARSRYSAEWQTPDDLDDETDPLWSIVGFGPDEQGARADLAARTAHNGLGDPDVQIRNALGELVNDLELMNVAIDLAERYAQGAFNTAQTTFDADERLKLTHAGAAWAETRSTLLRIAMVVHDERAQAMTKPSRPIILREMPATKTTDQAEPAPAEPYRHYAEWETPEGVCDEPDPMWSAVGFGATGQDAYIDLIAKTAHDRRSQSDEELYALLAGHVLILEEAAERAEHYAASAFNTATGETSADAEMLIELGQTWTQTAATLRRMPKPEPTEPAAELPPEVAQVSRALEALFGEMPPEARQSHTFSVGLKTSDGRPVVAIVATRNAKVLAEFARLGVLDPTWDAPPADSSEPAAEEIVEDVNFTSPCGQAFDGSPADVGAAVAEALIEHDGETWSLPSVIRDHAAEHLARVLDATQWSSSARAAAYHLYRLTTAATDGGV